MESWHSLASSNVGLDFVSMMLKFLDETVAFLFVDYASSIGLMRRVY